MQNLKELPGVGNCLPWKGSSQSHEHFPFLTQSSDLSGPVPGPTGH